MTVWLKRLKEIYFFKPENEFDDSTRLLNRNDLILIKYFKQNFDHSEPIINTEKNVLLNVIRKNADF